MIQTHGEIAPRVIYVPERDAYADEQRSNGVNQREVVARSDPWPTTIPRSSSGNWSKLSRRLWILVVASSIETLRAFYFFNLSTFAFDF